MSDYVPIAERIDGVVVLTRTCDTIRSWQNRPSVEIFPLAKADDEFLEQVRQLERQLLPAFQA